MISCRRARALLVENVREAAGEAALLSLDQHLAACAECRLERARWQAVGSLRQWQPPQLGAAARERILKKLRQPRAAVVPARRSRTPAFALAGLAVAAGLFVLWPKHAPVETLASTLAGAEITYGRGAVATLEPKSRTIRLETGEIDVKGRAPLSIRAQTYLVRLTEAHAVFAADSVRVLSGEVFVYSLDEKQLAKLSAGQGWPPPTAVAPAPIPAARRPAVATPALATPAAPKLSAAAALDKARSALADGDAVSARRWIQRALAAATSPRDRAEAEMFTAESYLVERDAARALAQYRRVAARYAQLPEGEAAAFAAAQVLSERGDNSAFHDYLARYPEGRFAREARDRLKE
jgi:hypothetical protein